MSAITSSISQHSPNLIGIGKEALRLCMSQNRRPLSEKCHTRSSKGEGMSPVQPLVLFKRP